MTINTTQFFQEERYKSAFYEYKSSQEEFCTKELSKESFVASSTTLNKVNAVFNKAAFILTTLAISLKLERVSKYTFPIVKSLAIPQLSFFTPYSIPLGIFIIARKIVSIAISHLIYPATLLTPSNVDQCRQSHFRRLEARNFILKRVTIEKSGIAYDAFLIGNSRTIHNGNWCLSSPGNAVVSDLHLEEIAIENHTKYGLNTLIVNGPSVGNSKGWPTTQRLADSQEAGMQFLENNVNAKNIVLKGQSLGGGALSQAILDHNFAPASSKNIHYMLISDRSFDTLSNAASKLTFRIASPILRLLGLEFNGVKGAKKLQELNIKHVVIQKGELNDSYKLYSDGVIDSEASLAYGMINEDLTESERLTYLLDPNISHNGPLPESTQGQLEQNIYNFINK
jgi:hypothetical protein